MKNSKKKLKLIFINIFILIVFIILIETLALIGREYLNKKFLGWVFVSSDNYISQNIDNNCLRMITHPILFHVHEHNNNCLIKDGYAEGSFIFYNDNNINNEKIITLGGSTTDGFYQQYSNGNTYPLLLDKIFKSKGYNIDIINGGVGGYNSTQELLKIITEVSELNLKTKIIISFNGINELWGYGQNNLYSNKNNSFIKSKYKDSPYLSTTLYSMYLNQIWIKQNKYVFFKFLPNIQSLIIYLTRKNNFEKTKFNNLTNNYTLNLNNIERWEKNITLMYKIAKSSNISYFTFLQPTLGIKGVQSKPKPNTVDEEIYNSINKDYLNELNEFYNQAKKKCEVLKFCYDLSDIAPPTGSNYSDARHHNANGNSIIAKLIYDILSEKLK
jgi:hypothetical protein